MFDKIAGVMLHYFGDEAKELLEESSETMIGDFCDPYNFYTTIGKSIFKYEISTLDCDNPKVI